jgi:hypothetical protein
MSDKRTGVELIAQERRRQVEVEGWTPKHDDEQIRDALTRAVQCYARAAEYQLAGLSIAGPPPALWPWEDSWWKPSPDPVRNLVKAGALIAAEIDRLLRRGRQMSKVRIVTIAGDYDVLVGKRWKRGFDRMWKAKLYAAWLRWTMPRSHQTLPDSMMADGWEALLDRLGKRLTDIESKYEDAQLDLKNAQARAERAEALLKSKIPTIGLGTLWVSKDWDGTSEMNPATKEQMDRLDITRDENGIIVSVKVKSLCGNCGKCLDCLRMERS